MGTSSSHGGPKGKNPLLPDDFIENDIPSSDSQEQNLNQSHDLENPYDKLWQNTKSQISKLVKDTSRSTSSALSSYIKAYGGAKNASATAITGKNVTINFGRVLSNISSQGIRKTLESYNIQYENRSAEEILGEFINLMSPNSEFKEDAAARKALIDTIENLYTEIIVDNKNIELLDSFSDQKFNELISSFISCYIFERFLKDLESRFEMYLISTGSTLKLENDIKEYIAGVVDNSIKDKNLVSLDYSSPSIKETIDNIYSDCYEVIEGVF